jgi:hypothetical protein
MNPYYHLIPSHFGEGALVLFEFGSGELEYASGHSAMIYHESVYEVIGDAPNLSGETCAALVTKVHAIADSEPVLDLAVLTRYGIVSLTGVRHENDALGAAAVVGECLSPDAGCGQKSGGFPCEVGGSLCRWRQVQMGKWKYLPVVKVANDSHGPTHSPTGPDPISGYALASHSHSWPSLGISSTTIQPLISPVGIGAAAEVHGNSHSPTGPDPIPGYATAGHSHPEYQPTTSGTFTPVVMGATIPGSGTYSMQWGRYQRMGDLYFLQARIAWTSHTGSGQMAISNLPTSIGNPSPFSVVRIAPSPTLPLLAVGENNTINLWGANGSPASVPPAGELLLSGWVLN